MRLLQEMIAEDKSRKTILSANWKQLDVFSRNIKQNELRGTKIEEQSVILQRIKICTIHESFSNRNREIRLRTDSKNMKTLKQQ